MKKLGIGSRLLAALLALTMVVSMLPVSVFADDGDTSSGSTGLSSPIDTLDTISWPIKVYDYLNDGLLFEYASATHHSDQSSPNAAYGGGKVMPVFTLGNDYTVNGKGSSTESTGAYKENAFTHWMKKVSGYSAAVAEQGKGTPGAFKFLRLQPDGNYGDSMPGMVLSDFTNDNSNTYDNEAVRYAVLVYKTNVNQLELTLGMSASNLNGTYYVRYGSYKSNITNPGGSASGPDGKLVNFELVESAYVSAPTDSENPWNYIVIDMNKGPNAAVWSQIGNATQIILDTNMSTADQYLDLSHVAYFADEDEAKRFGERAAAFSNDPGEYLPDQYYSVSPGATGNPRPSGATFSVDFTTDAAYSSATATAWANVKMFNNTFVASSTQGSGDKIQFARYGCDSDGAPDSSTFVEFDSAKSIDSVRYMALVYRSSAGSAACTDTNCTKGINFWFESSDLYDKAGYNSIGKSASATYWYDFDHKTGWNVAIFDLKEHTDMQYEISTNGVTSIDRVKVVCPGFDDDHTGADEYMDISHIAFFSTEEAATAYGNAALTYNADPGTDGGTTYTGYKHWNMGNNTAFTMLYASGGGGWRDPDGDGVSNDSTAGGENPWSNGYFSYQLGESVTWPDGEPNGFRKSAKTLGYPVPDDIYFFSAYDGEGTTYDRSYDLSNYDFGYTLYNTITDGVMTAGILQNDLVELTGVDGKTYRVPNYKQSAVEYIALLLKNTLAIGQTDQCGNYNFNFVQGSPSAQYSSANNGHQTAELTLSGNQDLYTLSSNTWSSTTGEAAPTTRTVYLENDTGSWENLHAHYWNDSTSTEWPGVAMTHVEGNRYSIEIPTSATNIIFNNGSGGDGNQTWDLTLTGTKDLYTLSTNSWGYANPNATRTIYFENDTDATMDWDNLHAYYWNEEGALVSLPGVAMTHLGDNRYSAEISVYATNVIFKDGNLDLASALRLALGLTEINSATGNYKTDDVPMGEYSTTIDKASQLVGAFTYVDGNINSFMDAAYFLMHNLFVDDSYNQLQDDYHYLMLSKAKVTATGKEAFVFDAGFTTGDHTADSVSAVKYNEEAGTISLTSSAGKDQVEYSGGQLTTRYPFMPVQDAEGDYAQKGEYATNGTPYFVEDGADSVTDYGATYAKRNYNYVMQANAEFIFQNQDDLFFQFEGDDDVYLFVNNELVLDIGAAHSITKVSMNMNDYVLQAQKELYQFKLNYGYRPSMTDEAFLEMLVNDAGITDKNVQADYLRWHHLNLVDGQSYPIDFYYMERHGWGANMRVATNIVMTDPAMDTEKKAYQDGGEISYGGLVDGDKSVEYSFSVTNKGQNKLYNLKFHDYDIGVSLTPEEGLVVTNDGITDARGLALDPADLIVQVDGYLDEEKTMPVSRSIRFNGQNPDQELKDFLKDLRSSGTESGDSEDLFEGSGLWRHATVTIRGIYYKLTAEQIAAKVFNNAVFTTANPAVDSETILNSVDTHQVRIDKDAKYIYQWADHNVYVNPADLIKWVTDGGSTITINGYTYSASDLYVDTCRNDGVSYDYPDIVVKQNHDGLIVNYLEPGSQLVFVKLYSKTNSNNVKIIPLAVYTTDVQDDVIVLDYGLKAELTGKNGITSNDYIIVPNRNTQYTIVGVAQERKDNQYNPSYLSNTSNYAYNDYNRISFYHAEDAVTSTDPDTKVTTTTLGFSDGDYSYYKEEAGEDTKLFFTPTDFMDETYTIFVAVSIHEGDAPSAVGPANNSTSGAYSIDITKEVQMYQKITVLPATVMYYENDFAGVNYQNWNGSAVDENLFGSGSDAWIQGVDQSVNYGADQVYQTGKEIDPATRQPVGNDVISANSMAAVKIDKYDKVAQFTFQGTGFELIGRTNAFDAATMVVNVRDGKQTGDIALVAPVSQTERNDLYTISTGTWSTANLAERTIYLDTSWKSAYVQYADASGSLIDWPGVVMQKVQPTRFRVNVPAGAAYVVFNDGTDTATNTQQTLPDTLDLFSLSSKTWSSSKSTRTIYVDVDEGWSTPYAYYFSATNKNMISMPGATMVPVGDNRYKVEIPAEATHVKFTNVLRSLPVINEFSNTDEVVCNHAYHNTEGHCASKDDFVGCGSYVGHLYYQDVCTVCGAGRVDYYLAGHINGADYGFTSDSSKPGLVNVDNSELGEYKFVDGKLTVTFKSDSYVFVKTSPVQTAEGQKSSVFMTDGYPGTGTRTAFLHNVNSGVNDPNKLHVPGGVELTFTLAEYWEGQNRLSLNLSYTTANDDVAEADKVIYFNNTENWETPTAYYWSSTNPTMVVWPGSEMSYVKDNVYKIELPADAEYIIFNNGVVEGSEVRQSPDLTVPANSMIYNFSGFNQGWANYAEGMTTVKFKNVKDWQQVYAYYWAEDNEMVQWPGVEMTETSEENVFEIMIPENATFIKFNNGTDATEKEETDTLDVVPGDTYVYGKGWLSQSTSSVRDIYFKNTESWSQVNVYYWSENNQNMTAWPGEGMECEEGDIFHGTIPNTAQWVIFTDGTNQTADIYLDPEMDESLNMFVYDKSMSENAIPAQWYVYGEEPSDSGSTEVTSNILYVQPNSNWNVDNARFAAYFFGNGDTWRDCTLVAGSDGIYQVEAPSGYPSVIFCRMNPNTTENNWDNKWNQTSDLTIPADGTNCYIVEAGSWDEGNGQWTTYTPASGVSEMALTTAALTASGNEYCLVGYINGADYGCNDDYQNVGEYIFVDGKLTTSFAADSYIFIKTTDNLNWYMSEAYCTETTGTFVTGASEKMFVPGNVDLTFTLVENEDGSLTLSYVTGSEEDATPKDIYFTNDRRWSKVYVHYWNLSGTATSEYPGVEMTVLEDGTYTAQIPGNAQYVIFNNGTEGTKTKDLLLPTGGANTYTDPIPECGTWEHHDPKRTLYFDLAGAAWGETINAHYWNDATSTEWPGVAMEHVSGTVYSIRVPMDAQYIIFNDGTNQTSDLLIQDGLNLYTYATGRWSSNTRIVYYEANSTGSVRVTYWAEGGEANKQSKIMSLLEGRVYRCELPMDAKYVKFEEGNDIVYETCLSDDHNLYSAAGWSVYDPASQYFTEIYFNNTLDWQNVHIYYWSDANKQMMTFPGTGMTFVSGSIYMATIPAAATKVVFSQVVDGVAGPQTADLTIAKDKPMFTVSESTDDQGKHTGTWGAYVKPETDAIHQVPVLRVDDLPLGSYIVDICGVPTYDTTAENWWLDKDNHVLDTYLYLDGLRIYQPLGSTNSNYAPTENGAQFQELRNLILQGYAAVAQYTKGKDYNSTNTYVGNVSWTENRNGVSGDWSKVYKGNQLSSNEDYLLIGPNNETYLNGNAQTQAVILYVTETEAENHSLQIAARGIDAGLFLGKDSTGVNATLYYGIWAEQPNGGYEYAWRPLDTVLSGVEQYYTIDYTACPYQMINGVKTYQVALYIRSGMVSFTNVKTVGLNLTSAPLSYEIDEQLNYGLVVQPGVGTGSGNVSGDSGSTTPLADQMFYNLDSISTQMAATEQVEDTQELPITLKYPSLSFEDEVFYNIYYSIDGLDEMPVEMGLLLFDSLEEDGTVDSASAIVSGSKSANGLYVARTDGVAAKDLGKTIYFKVFAQLADGRYVYSKAASYSTLSYAQTILTGDSSAETKAMVAAMLNYGAAAQSYFGGISPIGSLLTDSVKSLIGDYSSDLLDDVVSVDAGKTGDFRATAEGFSKKYPSVTFDGAFAINYYFAPSAPVQGDMTLYYWNAEDYAAADQLTADNATGSIVMTPGTEYSAVVDAIAAKDMDETVYVAAVYSSNGSDYCSGVLAYSLGAYCELMAESNADISAFAQATAIYGNCAKKLFG